jgi:YVTN family beta-propeller protein
LKLGTGNLKLLHVIPLVFSVLLGTGCQTEQLPNYPRAYREYAYVTNGKSNTVSVLDIDTYKSIKTVAVGVNPSGVAANPAKNEVYVVNTGSNSVSVIDAETNRIVSVIGVGATPYFIDISADGTRGYVANSDGNSISVIDLAQHKVIRTVPAGKSPGLARVSPNGKLIVISNRGEDSISLIDAQTLEARSRISVCKQPTELVILPDSSKVFVACSGSSQVAVVALAEEESTPSNSDAGKTESKTLLKPQPQAASSGQLKTLAREPMPAAQRSQKAASLRTQVSVAGDRLLALLDVGKTPLHLALKPDGGEIFVSNFDGDSVSEINTTTNEVGGSYLIGRNPVRALVSPDNSTLFVSNFGSDTIGVYSIDDGKWMKSVPVGNHPDAMALSPNQNFLFVCDTTAGDVSVIRTAARQGAVLLTIIPVGQQPNAIAVKAFILRKPPVE